MSLQVMDKGRDFHSLLIPPDMSGKDHKSRLTLFADWLASGGHDGHLPPLEAYRDYLLEKRGLKAASVSAHLSTIRARYQMLLRSNTWRDYLYGRLPDDLTPADKKAMFDEYLSRLQNAVHPDNARVKEITKQDTADGEHLRLTQAQANQLLLSPDVNTLTGLRDAALLALTLCTGIREAELCAVQVEHLRQQFGGELALMVPKGKGYKQRLIPFGELQWCLVYVDTWLKAAGISEGFVFRGFYKSGKQVRKTPLTVRAVNQILEKYPIAIGGELRKVAPHDLRRTYARRQYEEGMDVIAIQQNLGHADLKTTLHYIGAMDSGKRRGRDVYGNPGLDRLPKVI
jgi:site-specific recombinase XerD